MIIFKEKLANICLFDVTGDNISIIYVTVQIWFWRWRTTVRYSCVNRTDEVFGDVFVLSICFLEFSVGTRAFVIRLSDSVRSLPFSLMSCKDRVLLYGIGIPNILRPPFLLSSEVPESWSGSRFEPTANGSSPWFFSLDQSQRPYTFTIKAVNSLWKPKPATDQT